MVRLGKNFIEFVGALLNLIKLLSTKTSNSARVRGYIGIRSWDLHIVISPDFSLELTGFFQGKHLIHFLVLKMKDFWNFVLDNCILDFDAEQVYLKLQVTNLKNNEVQ